MVGGMLLYMMYTLAGPRARLAADARALLDDALR